MHLNDVLGMEVRGMPLTALILPESRDDMTAALASVFDEPATVQLCLTSDKGLGRSAMEARMLLLPLRSDLGDVSRVLGCFVAEGKIGRAPRRFNIVAQSRRTLIGFGGAGSDAASPLSAGPRERGENTQLPESPKPQPGRPHLRLVTNQD